MLKFGERQRQARRRIKINGKTMTQTQLAQTVRVHPNTISDIERGQLFPGLELGLRISEALNVNVRWLCGQTTNPRRGIQLDSDLEERNYRAYLAMSPAERQQFAEGMADFLKARHGPAKRRDRQPG